MTLGQPTNVECEHSANIPRMFKAAWVSIYVSIYHYLFLTLIFLTIILFIFSLSLNLQHCKHLSAFYIFYLTVFLSLSFSHHLSHYLLILFLSLSFTIFLSLSSLSLSLSLSHYLTLSLYLSLSPTDRNRVSSNLSSNFLALSF